MEHLIPGIRNYCNRRCCNFIAKCRVDIIDAMESPAIQTAFKAPALLHKTKTTAYETFRTRLNLYEQALMII